MTLSGFIGRPCILPCFMVQCLFVTASFVQIQYSQRNIPANKSRKYVRSVAIPEAYDGGGLLQTLPTELADHAVQSWSPSGKAGSVHGHQQVLGK